MQTLCMNDLCARKEQCARFSNEKRNDKQWEWFNPVKNTVGQSCEGFAAKNRVVVK